MKMIIVLAALVAIALAADKDVEVVEYENDNIGVEGYKYGVKLSDGQVKAESGHLVNVGTEDEGIEVEGSYSYTGPDNVVYTITYRAGPNGFEPQGAHIPVA